jgi:hypothetical protein
MLIGQNEVYTVELVLSKDKKSYRLKTYSEKGIPILHREQKARSLGVESVWI